MRQAHVFISGNVQGVGYRYFVFQTAQKLGLTGWVRNTKDGRVEAVIQGEENVIEQIIELCKTGSAMAKVDNISFEWEEIDKTLTQFIIH